MNTKIYKDSHYGWKAETVVDLGDNKELRILTMKRSDGRLSTNAQRVTVDRGMISFMMFSDFSKTYKSAVVRCTEKNVTQQHNEVIALVEQIKKDCVSFYRQNWKKEFV
jgi:hypothetical protein